MYILYGGDYTRSTLVQWVLEEGRIPYEHRRIDLEKAENRAPEFIAINPAGLVPVLVTPEGETLTEVAALMLYLAERHRLTELAPPVGGPDWGLFLSTVFHIASDIQAEIKRFHYPHRYSLRLEDNLGIQEQSKALVLSRLGVLDTRLAKQGPYLLGPRFSLADYYLCFWIAYVDRETACRQFPAFARLYGLVRSRPIATRYLEETEQASDVYAEQMRQNPGGVVA